MRPKHIVLVAGLLLLFGVIWRLVPHAPNMTPIAALAFVGSWYLGKQWAVVLPLAAVFVSDIVIGFYDWRIMLAVYGSFALIGCVSLIARSHRTLLPVTISVVSSSFLFFFITNGAVWAFSPWYEKTFSGLLYAYELGLPFLRNMLIGDVAFTLVLVAAFEAALAFTHMRPRLGDWFRVGTCKVS